MRGLIIAAFCLIILLPAGGAEGRLYPEGNVFPIGGYSPDPERDKAAGFTIAGPSYGRQDADERLAKCEAIGLPFIYPVGLKKVDLRTADGGTQAVEIEAIQRDIREQVARVAGSKAIYAWYLTPEELRYWRANEMEYLRTASAAIREADPLERPVWMYEPGHRDRASLEQTFPYQGLAGKGMYVEYAGYGNQRGWLRWAYAQQREAVQAMKSRMVSFAVLEMFRNAPDLIGIRDSVRHDCYASLLEGAEGIMVFSFTRRSGFHNRTAFYEAYAEVARELTQGRKLGSVFLRGEEVEGPDFEIVSGPKEVRFEVGPKAERLEVKLPSLRWKTLLWEEQRYFFVVNSAAEPVTIRWQTDVVGEPLWTAQPKISSKGMLTLEPWQVAGFIRGRNE